MFHIQTLSFSVNYLSNAPCYLMISSHPDDILKLSRRNMHECNRCSLWRPGQSMVTRTRLCVSHIASPNNQRCESSAGQIFLSCRPYEFDLTVVRHCRGQGPGLRHGTQQRAKRRHSSCDEMSICLCDDDHLVQTFGSPSQISPAFPTRSYHSCRIPVAAVLAFRDITASCLPSTWHLCECLGACRLTILRRS
jgi:hypothetical protein